MTRFRRLMCGCAVAAAVGAGDASAASAQTFYVNKRGGEDTLANPCTTAVHACETIDAAIVRAEASPGANTIMISPEDSPYEEAIDLNSASDKGLLLVGEEEGVEILGKSGTTVSIGASAGTVTFSHLRVLNQSGAGAAIADNGAALELDDVSVENESTSGVNGIEVRKFGSLTLDGGSVTMENGASGAGVYANESPLTLNGTTITAGGGSEAEAGGVYSTKSGMSITSSKIGIEGGKKEETSAIRATEDGLVQLHSDAVRQEGLTYGVALEDSTAAVDGLSVKMGDAADKKDAVAISSPSSSSFEHLETTGAWAGPAFLGLEGSIAIADSQLITSASHVSPALLYLGSVANSGLAIQRSILQAAPAATPAVLQVAGAGSATIDSSEILGGSSGVAFTNKLEGTSTLTLASSTLDAGAPGLVNDATGVHGIVAAAEGTFSNAVKVAIEGSIVLEPQLTETEAGDHVSLSCSYAAVPSQSQPEKTGEGSIGCASASNGNTDSTAELGTLFSAPFGSYVLSPTSAAVNSVPVSAIALPFGLTPSTTDREGNPRFEDVGCVAMQDKGALQLQGHATPCPAAVVPISAPVSPKPLAGAITGLLISPSAFLPAPSGATVSSARRKARKRYGATISYRDSQAATTTFTVLRKSSGREQGRSCKKPSKKNKYGKHCTLLSRLGSFTHVDAPGANSLHFSGRLSAKKLAPGSYELQAVAHDAAGSGAAAIKSFTIR